MSKLSITKLNDYKKAKCYTNKKISKESGIPIATVDRLFSGANKNPAITILQKIAAIFECTVDDFIEYEENSPLYSVHIEKETMKLAKEIQENEKIKEIMKAVAALEKEDREAVGHIILKLGKKN